MRRSKQSELWQRIFRIKYCLAMFFDAKTKDPQPLCPVNKVGCCCFSCPRYRTSDCTRRPCSENPETERDCSFLGFVMEKAWEEWLKNHQKSKLPKNDWFGWEAFFKNYIKRKESQ